MIEIENMSKYYGDYCALNSLNLNIGKGRVFGFIGPNGAGKTTTIRIVAALMRPSSGTCRVADVVVTENPRRTKELVGYLPDFFGVYEGMRVYEYLDFFGAAFKIPRKKRKKRIDHVLEVTCGEYMSDMFVEALSRGMKQKVGIARTLIHNPDVLLFDEPLSGLDPTARVEMKTVMRNLAEEGKTSLVSSHILPELSAIADSIGIVNRGNLIADGKVDEVMQTIRQERLLEVRFLSDPAQAAKYLREKREKHGIKNISVQDHTLRFEWKANDEQIAKMLAALINSGHSIVEYREVPISLEEAFMELTG